MFSAKSASTSSLSIPLMVDPNARNKTYSLLLLLLLPFYFDFLFYYYYYYFNNLAFKAGLNIKLGNNYPNVIPCLKYLVLPQTRLEIVSMSC